MRIRKRPAIPLSSSSVPCGNSDPTSLRSLVLLQLPNGGKGESVDQGNPPPLPQLDPKTNHTQVINEEKEVKLDPDPDPSSSSSDNTLDTQPHNNGRDGEAAGAAVPKKKKGGVEPTTNTNGKKKRSPASLMEGSRCSRVNGRGWRCSQQTLIGYSLCEHHLGKGRLRSVSSVQGGIKIMRTTRNIISIEKKKDLDDEGDEDGRMAARVLASLQKEQFA